MKKLSLFLLLLLTLSACQKQEAEPTQDPEPEEPEQIEEQTAEEPEPEEEPAPEPISTTLYEGDWFDIDYPSNFTATPGGTADEAYFTSPDGEVEFFVYSPLWGGDPEKYLEIASNEELVSEKTEDTGQDLERSITYWATFQATDGSYTRSLVSIRNQVDTGSDLHHVFGIKYANEQVYSQYKAAYQAFKDSLTQYAD